MKCPLGCGDDVDEDDLRDHYLDVHPDYAGLRIPERRRPVGEED